MRKRAILELCRHPATPHGKDLICRTHGVCNYLICAEFNSKMVVVLWQEEKVVLAVKASKSKMRWKK